MYVREGVIFLGHRHLDVQKLGQESQISQFSSKYGSKQDEVRSTHLFLMLFVLISFAYLLFFSYFIVVLFLFCM